eukprot:6019652-Karenia_brevis.AAC.1
MVFIPKAAGGRRPIGLFCTLIRIWTRMRRAEIRRWEVEYARTYLWGGLGKPADMAMWDMSFYDEASSALGCVSVAGLIDI